MRAEDLIYEVDEEIEKEKKEKAKSILKAQRKQVDELQTKANKAADKYEDMLEMDVDELIEEYGVSGEITYYPMTGTTTYSFSG